MISSPEKNPKQLNQSNKMQTGENVMIKCFSVPFCRAVGNAHASWPQDTALPRLLLRFQQSLLARCSRKCEGLAGWDSHLTTGVRQTQPFLHHVVLKRVMDPRADIDNTQQKTTQKEILIQGGNPSNLLILETAILQFNGRSSFIICTECCVQNNTKQ